MLRLWLSKSRNLKGLMHRLLTRARTQPRVITSTPLGRERRGRGGGAWDGGQGLGRLVGQEGGSQLKGRCAPSERSAWHEKPSGRSCERPRPVPERLGHGEAEREAGGGRARSKSKSKRGWQWPMGACKRERISERGEGAVGLSKSLGKGDRGKEPAATA